ncbi:hypothetical protein Poli38472_008392 [Pythium oligandrum]|uniref:Uncharacterized protein n=1 Tax=Pythium oligandrum TaxID=41045 RepID=A0A8K1CNB5_PYTOL|nr:hypothetical protein Poli38472_008392 [Pythium oligandrum]|eukprot:TMW65750.1 hypothetical protein Poli38472_008392 [Pythium oligandrum]
MAYVHGNGATKALNGGGGMEGNGLGIGNVRGLSAMGNGSNKRRNYADPEYAAISDFLSTIGEVDEPQGGAQAKRQQTARGRAARGGGVEAEAADSGGAARRSRSSGGNDTGPRARQTTRRNAEVVEEEGDDDDEDEDDFDSDDNGDNQSDRSDKSSGGGRQASSRHTKLTDLEQHVRNLERENLHLKQTLLLGKKGTVIISGRSTGGHENLHQKLNERTRIVQEMVDQLNAPVLSLGDAARVWHEDCRIGVGVREWDAFGRLEAISLWSVIRSIFATIAVDIVELRPHLSDGEMILTKWRIQGEIASPAQLDAVCSSEDCPETMRVAIRAIKSSDLTFTVTTYVIFHDTQIAEQHHCWDQVGVFKRLFGGEIPPSVQAMLTVPEDDEDEEDE